MRSVNADVGARSGLVQDHLVRSARVTIDVRGAEPGSEISERLRLLAGSAADDDAAVESRTEANR